MNVAFEFNKLSVQAEGLLFANLPVAASVCQSALSPACSVHRVSVLADGARFLYDCWRRLGKYSKTVSVSLGFSSSWQIH